MARVQTKTEFKTYNEGAEIPVTDLNVNSILFTNKGQVTVYINSFPLAVGESWGDSRNANEIITGKFVIAFEAGAGPVCHVQLVRYV